MQNIVERCSVSKPLKDIRKGDWTPHSQGALKFNVDRSARGSHGPVGIGGVFRDHCGKVLRSFPRNIGIAYANTVELWQSIRLVYCVLVHRLCLEK